VRLLPALFVALFGAGCSGTDGPGAPSPTDAPPATDPLVVGSAPAGFPSGPLAETGPADNVLNTDGNNLGVSGTATDLAGNTSQPAGVTGINTDGTPPQSQAALACTSQNGWCRGQTATVTLTATLTRPVSAAKTGTGWAAAGDAAASPTTSDTAGSSGACRPT